ncbi:FIST N-terminal domain-containing protein [Marivita sp. XM-24bin2]|uniref:FIST N-terminal domain-containing protein n=1 Tax=unclassified Marivita TaxID=2632480 RepID=UPI000D7A4D27|nr:FIST N-terminal domain-containing protein [Marivita sp. XM-24bin2]MCR9107954.1 FIST C-terminal domain-containing protein [Paracoccaceae bacterium]PWL35065.1 MAG: GfdT protein [Marivita sp. XM-24bin2]
MEGCRAFPEAERSETAEVIAVAQVRCDDPASADQIATQLGPGPFELVCLFVSPEADFAALVTATAHLFGGADVLACTTAGEIGRAGYEDDQIIAVGFRKDHFKFLTYAIENLDEIEEQSVADTLIEARLALTQTTPDWMSEFAFLMVDGMSLREEQLTAFLSAGLGPTPLFGGSSGDGTRFGQTWLARNGTVMQNAAIVVVGRCDRPVRVFSLDHLIPTEQRMVVTSATPENRIVHEINAEPAALEYARLLGLDPHQLDQFTFAEHPVVVRLGDVHHVRAIQQVKENHDLVFFSAINEGMVLTLATHDDIVAHLDRGLSELGKQEKPEFILGCDCILRRIEAGRLQKTRAVSDVLSAHNVIGFSTYGEQIGGLHVNQTLTGVAIYPAHSDEATDVPD